MTERERQKKEIETIRERTLTLKLSDEDCEKLLWRCGICSITPAELLENFIGDLIGGTYSNGSDEREFANMWAERCRLEYFPENTLLKWLFDEWIDVGEFLELLDNIKDAEETLKDREACPEKYDEEEIEYLLIDRAEWKQELEEYYSEFQKVNPKADWRKEVENVKKWYEEKERFVNGQSDEEYNK